MNTLSEENYLKAILRLSQKPDEKITPTSIAEALGNNAASVVDMIRKLTDKQLIEYDKKKGVRLTPQGLKDSVLIVRKHRLWEVFLLEKLGYHWDEIHDIAEELEHIKDDTLADRLDQFLGFPEHDPHGDPIPTPEGTIRADHFESLLTCPVATPLRVTRIADQDPAFLHFIENNHLKPGQAIEVEERDTAADSVRVKSPNRESITIGARAASKLFVEVDGR